LSKILNVRGFQGATLSAIYLKTLIPNSRYLATLSTKYFFETVYYSQLSS